MIQKDGTRGIKALVFASSSFLKGDMRYVFFVVFGNFEQNGNGDHVDNQGDVPP